MGIHVPEGLQRAVGLERPDGAKVDSRRREKLVFSLRDSDSDRATCHAFPHLAVYGLWSNISRIGNAVLACDHVVFITSGSAIRRNGTEEFSKHTNQFCCNICFQQRT